MRVVNFVLFGLMIGMLMLIYQQKHETRQLEARAGVLARDIADQTRALAVLRAEWTYLTRPDRLEKLARETMGLAPIAPDQIARFADVEARSGAVPVRQQDAKP